MKNRGLTDEFRGIGLHAAMYSVPVMLFVTGLMMWMTSKTYLGDVEKVKCLGDRA